MKEKIYTIPVTDAFNVECECCMCVLHKKLEEEYVDYILGPSLMEPEGRIDTNQKGFCRDHFELLYNKQVNRLGLGLILDTHLVTQTENIKKLYNENLAVLKKDAGQSLIKGLSNKLTSKQSDSGKFIDQLVLVLENLDTSCSICSKLEHTVDRYIDVVLYLWFHEIEFTNLFNSKKGFCLLHFKMLLQGAKKYLTQKEAAIFTENLIKIQLDNLSRIQEEVNWFTKKFDYRFNDASWGNSKDSLQRSIQKIVGYSELK